MASPDDDNILETLLKQNKILQEAESESGSESEPNCAEDDNIVIVQSNLDTFATWMRNRLAVTSELHKLYSEFCSAFSADIRINLFEQIHQYFHNESIVTDDIIFYWKCIVVCLISISKKYKMYVDDIDISVKERTNNITLVVSKYIFRCFINAAPVCTLKENGTDYYLS